MTTSVIYKLPLYTGQLYSKFKTLFSGSCLVTAVIYKVTAIDRVVIHRFDCILIS